MNQSVKSLYFQLTSLIPIDWLKRNNPSRMLLPYHHLVGDHPVPHIQHLYSFKTTKEFENDLDYLLKHFRPVSLDEILFKIKNKEPLDPNSFLLSFDDGLREIYENVAPILLRKGLPAVFFLNSAFLDNKDLFYRFKVSLILDKIFSGEVTQTLLEIINGRLKEGGLYSGHLEQDLKRIDYPLRSISDLIGQDLGISFSDYLKEIQPFLNSDQVRWLISHGFHIGSHSIDHPIYSKISLAEQVRQTLESTEFLVDRFHLNYRVFAFPHLDIGVGMSFFEKLGLPLEPKIDVIFGNSNQKFENYPQVLHRFIGENPQIPINLLIPGIISYGKLNCIFNKNRIKRD